jgi:hypothetical protein
MYGDHPVERAAIERRRGRRRAVIAIAAAVIAVAVTVWLWWPQRGTLPSFGGSPEIDFALRSEHVVVRAPAATAVWLYRDEALIAVCPDEAAAEADRCAIERGQRVLTATATAAGRYTILVVASLRPGPPTLAEAVAELTRDGVWFRRHELVVE